VFIRGICNLFGRGVRTLWLAKYGMDTIDHASREQFLRKVERRLRAF
jgi:hypothetical protein